MIPIKENHLASVNVSLQAVNSILTELDNLVGNSTTDTLNSKRWADIGIKLQALRTSYQDMEYLVSIPQVTTIIEKDRTA